ncbi:MAG: hypothetical protein OXU45_01555 [Candidatus Melainabacteria bacterium]|nr:hypothetical protein [Candidatus Melainabacteria bacterium]
MSQSKKIKISYQRRKRQSSYEIVDAEVVSEPKSEPGPRSTGQTVNMLFKLNTNRASKVIKRHQQAHSNIRSLRFKD